MNGYFDVALIKNPVIMMLNLKRSTFPLNCFSGLTNGLVEKKLIYQISNISTIKKIPLKEY